MAASTRARVASLTRGLRLRTRETVLTPTPARAATSLIVAMLPPERYGGHAEENPSERGTATTSCLDAP